MSDGYISIDGRMIRVRSCTERRGLWIEMFWPKEKPSRADKVVDEITGRKPDSIDDKVEPDQYFFIPGDLRHCIAEDLVDTKLDVEPEDDEYEGVPQ